MMKPSHLITLTAGLCATLIGVSIALIHLNQATNHSEAPESSSLPTPSIAPNATRPSIETFINQYFEALNAHDFDTAYAFLSPAWGVDRAAFQRYWERIKAGTLQAEILQITQPSAKSAIVLLRWSGDRDGKTVKVKLKCSLRPTPTSYRIDQCQ